jgi:hypothetical protein
MIGPLRFRVSIFENGLLCSDEAGLISRAKPTLLHTINVIIFK